MTLFLVLLAHIWITYLSKPSNSTSSKYSKEAQVLPMTSKTAVSAQEAIPAQKELDIAIKILAHQNIFAQLALALQCYARQDGTVKELEKAWSSLLSVLKASFVL